MRVIVIPGLRTQRGRESSQNQRLAAGQAPRAGLWPGAAPSPVTVSPLSLTVCSQLDFFCPGVKGFSPRSLLCHLRGVPLHQPRPHHHVSLTLASSVVLNSIFRPMVMTIVISPALHTQDVTDFLQTCRGRHALNTVKM